MDFNPFFLAMLLIMQPADAPTTGLQELAPVIKLVATHWEIMDVRERAHMFQDIHDTTPLIWAADLAMLQRRYVDLLGTPLIEESARFPARDEIASYLGFNRNYGTWLTYYIMSLDDVRGLELQITLMVEVDRLYSIWDTLRDGQCEYYYISVRRASFARLRKEIGEEAYYSGNMPPYVPLKAFIKINSNTSEGTDGEKEK